MSGRAPRRPGLAPLAGLALLVLALAPAACGKRGDPIPPSGRESASDRSVLRSQPDQSSADLPDIPPEDIPDENPDQVGGIGDAPTGGTPLP